MVLANISMRNKLFFGFLCTALVAIMVIGWASYHYARAQLRAVTFERLTAARETKKDEIEKYFSDIRYQCLTISESTMTMDAMHSLRQAFYGVQVPEAQFETYKKDLTTFYEQEFLPKVNETSVTPKKLDEFFPTDRQTIIWQTLYLAQNPNPLAEKRVYSQAPDGSDYSKLHHTYHSIFSKYVKRFGFLDIYLVDIETGHVVFNISKEIDYATNLLTGPLKNTSLAATFKEIQKTSDENFVQLQDFAFYEPSYGIPASFIGTPIYQEGKKIGALIFQLPIDVVNNIMTYDKRWHDVGLGNSGETFIIGDDTLMRSLSRFFIEDQQGYINLLREHKYDSATIDKMNIYKTTILLQEVDTVAAKAITQGITDTQMGTDYRGIDVLASYTPLKIKDVSWGIIAKMDASEAFAPIRAIAWRITLWAFGVLLLIIIFTLFFIRFFTAPLKKIITILGAPQGIFSTQLPITSRDEIGTMAEGYNTLLATFADTMHRIKTIDGELHATYKTLDTAAQTAYKDANATTHLTDDHLSATQQALTTVHALHSFYSQAEITIGDTLQQAQRTHTTTKILQSQLEKVQTELEHTQTTQQKSLSLAQDTQARTAAALQTGQILAKELVALQTLIEKSDTELANNSLVYAHISATQKTVEQMTGMHTQLSESMRACIDELQTTERDTTRAKDSVNASMATNSMLNTEHERLHDTIMQMQKMHREAQQTHYALYESIQAMGSTVTTLHNNSIQIEQSVSHITKLLAVCKDVEKQLRALIAHSKLS